MAQIAEELRVKFTVQTDNAIKNLKQFKDAQNKLRRATVESANRIVKASTMTVQAWQSFGKRADAVRKEAKKLEFQMAALLKKGLDPQSIAVRKLRSRYDALNNEMREASIQNQILEESQQRANKRLEKASAIGKTLSFTLTPAILAAAGASIKFAADLEKTQASFETLLGSADEATKLFDEIKDFSAATPFQLPGLTSAASRLIGFGTAADEVVVKLRDLGNLAQGDTEIFNRLVDAFGKAQVKGKATLEELNRFAEAGVPIFEELAKNINVTTDELFAMISRGEVTFREVNTAIETLSRGSGKFAGLLERQSDTLAGKISTLKDNVAILGAELVESLFPPLKELLDTLIAGVQKFAALDDETKKNILRFGAFLAVIGPLTSAITGIIGIVQTATAAITAMKLAVAGPVGLVAGLGLLIVATTKARRENRRYQRELRDFTNELNLSSVAGEQALSTLRAMEQGGYDFEEALRETASQTQFTTQQLKGLARIGEVYTEELEAMDAATKIEEESIDDLTMAMEGLSETTGNTVSELDKLLARFDFAIGKANLTGEEMNTLGAAIREDTANQLDFLAKSLENVGEQEAIVAAQAEFLRGRIQEVTELGFEPQGYTLTMLINQYEDLIKQMEKTQKQTVKFIGGIDFASNRIEEMTKRNNDLRKSLEGVNGASTDTGESVATTSEILKEFVDSSIKSFMQSGFLEAMDTLGQAVGGNEKALESFIKKIIESLPLLLLSTGLQVLPANKELGIALIAASGLLALGIGIAKGLESKAETETVTATDAAQQISEITSRGNVTTVSNTYQINGSVLANDELATTVGNRQSITQRGY